MGAGRSVPARAGRFGPLRDANFRRFFIGYAASLFGTGMEPVGVAFAVLANGGSPADLGAVLTGGVLATMLSVVIGGTVADRFGWRITMLGSDIVRCLAEGVFAALVLLGHAPLGLLVALYVVQNVAAGFYSPALFGLTPQIVPKDQLQQANVLLGVARDAGRVAGPAVAGVLAVATSAGVVLAVDAGTFAISVVSLAMLRLGPFVLATGESLLSSLKNGWQAWSSRSWIWITGVKFAISNAVVLAPYLVLGPIVADEHLGGAGGWGLILAAQGAGSVLTGALMIRRHISRPLVAITVVQAAWALPVLSLALLLPVPVIAVAAFLAGIGSAAFNAIFSTTLQRHVPPEFIARVTSYSYLSSYVLSPVGLAVAPLAASVAGTSAVLAVGAVWQAVSTVAVLWIPETRRFREPEPTREPREPESMREPCEPDTRREPRGPDTDDAAAVPETGSDVIQ